jgi:hypothetical protein
MACGVQVQYAKKRAELIVVISQTQSQLAFVSKALETISADFQTAQARLEEAKTQENPAGVEKLEADVAAINAKLQDTTRLRGALELKARQQVGLELDFIQQVHAMICRNGVGHSLPC